MIVTERPGEIDRDSVRQTHTRTCTHTDTDTDTHRHRHTHTHTQTHTHTHTQTHTHADTHEGRISHTRLVSLAVQESLLEERVRLIPPEMTDVPANFEPYLKAISSLHTMPAGYSPNQKAKVLCRVAQEVVDAVEAFTGKHNVKVGLSSSTCDCVCCGRAKSLCIPTTPIAFVCKWFVAGGWSVVFADICMARVF